MQDTVSFRQEKVTEHFKNIPSRRNVKGAFVNPKGSESVILEIKRGQKKLEQISKPVQEERGKEAFERKSDELVIEEITDDTNEVKREGSKTVNTDSEITLDTAFVGSNAKRFVRVVKNKLIPPIRFRRRTKHGPAESES